MRAGAAAEADVADPRRLMSAAGWELGLQLNDRSTFVAKALTGFGAGFVDDSPVGAG